MLMQNRIQLKKLTYVGKWMATSDQINVCGRALRIEKLTCKGKDLLTECQTWCTELDIPDVTDWCLDKNRLIKAVQDKNEKDIKMLAREQTKNRRQILR